MKLTWKQWSILLLIETFTAIYFYLDFLIYRRDYGEGYTFAQQNLIYIIIFIVFGLFYFIDVYLYYKKKKAIKEGKIIPIPRRKRLFKKNLR